jgi:hypothetical protein
MPATGGNYRYKQPFTAVCGQETLFLVPYGKPDRKGKDGSIIEGGIGSGVFCAVDDSMGHWPRFQEAIQEDSN